MMTFQLREYRIEDGRLDEFVREWRESVLPLRVAAGFSVIGPWLERDESRFVWILGYDGDIRSADAAYYASAGRVAVMSDPARLVAESRELWLEAPSQD
jgi:hypothetical protein